MSEMCCTRLAANTGRKKFAKNRHLGTIAQLCRAISSQLRHVSTIGKKLVKWPRSTKLCRMFGHLMHWCTIYAFLGAVVPNGILLAANFTFHASKSCLLLYWQRYCTALEQRPSVKLCGVVRGTTVTRVASCQTNEVV